MKKRTQKDMCYQAQKIHADMDKQFLAMVNHSTNPLTNKDLIHLVKHYPQRWQRYALWIGKLA